MINIRNNSSALLLMVLSLLLLCATQIAVASEVSGTLSSDGSSTIGKDSVLSETNTTQNAGLEQTSPQSNGQLQGSVVGGREESATLATINGLASSSSAVWLTLAVAVMLVATTYFIWRRRIV